MNYVSQTITHRLYDAMWLPKWRIHPAGIGGAKLVDELASTPIAII